MQHVLSTNSRFVKETVFYFIGTKYNVILFIYFGNNIFRLRSTITFLVSYTRIYFIRAYTYVVRVQVYTYFLFYARFDHKILIKKSKQKSTICLYTEINMILMFVSSARNGKTCVYQQVAFTGVTCWNRRGSPQQRSRGACDQPIIFFHSKYLFLSKIGNFRFSERFSFLVLIRFYF